MSRTSAKRRIDEERRLRRLAGEPQLRLALEMEARWALETLEDNKRSVTNYERVKYAELMMDRVIRDRDGIEYIVGEG